eukprot:Blabericola_migrator_1__746@NODE_1186_length_5187_cov_125_914258_g807_i0_p2_GENE_NODE_1186_length_5187_cov_125_914258_g807_i0NODE_1186_length_5187_cov_125_914258_g807_i0_p2_ORF_typecomplete_len429_score95_46tRNAsynt_2c/PF01411_19/4_5e10tRNA_SAD/PF07973_14/6e07DHHA1/PF02272_19/0_00051NdhN/PF11909_8/2_8e03NdhN/PF11909_8/2_7e03NdhN/PF11909_8/0_64ZapB/PF06005_12/4e03ZapB/PF06005_12/4_1e03ZapB/PF06005_12/1_6_NODE_1186_length_5187_cov_125_914258_g807_i024383724
MTPTRRLYLDDCYTTAVRGKVVSAERDGKKLNVKLDETYFYPTSGGQINDEGILCGLKVIDVIEDGPDVVHVLDVSTLSDAEIEKLMSTSLAVGTEVTGEVDAARRTDLRTQHSGQHLLSAILERRFGAKTVSAHFQTTTYLDLDKYEGIDVQELERLAAEAIMANVPVTIEYQDDIPPTSSESTSGDSTKDEETQLRKRSEAPKKKIHGRMRIIHIHGYDKNGCCGTHVRRTGELGLVLVHSLQKYKGGSRLTYTLGMRCALLVQQHNKTLQELQTVLRTPLVELPAAAKQLVDKNKEFRKEAESLRGQLAVLRAEKLLAETPISERGLREVVVEQEKLGDVEKMMGSTVKLSSLAVYVAAETGGQGPYQVCLAAAGDTKLNCSAAAKRLTAGGKGRGGGRPDAAQLSLDGKLSGADVLAVLLETRQ